MTCICPSPDTRPTVLSHGAWGPSDSTLRIDDPIVALALAPSSEADAVLAEIPGYGSQIIAAGCPWIGEARGPITISPLAPAVPSASYPAELRHRLELLGYHALPPGGVRGNLAPRRSPMFAGTAVAVAAQAGAVFARGRESVSLWIANDGAVALTWNLRGQVIRGGAAGSPVLDFGIVTGGSLSNGNVGFHHVHLPHADRVYVTVSGVNVPYRLALEADGHADA